jgi:hypothetical protein
MSAQPKYELFADMGEDSDARSVKKVRVIEVFPNVGHAMTFLLFDYGDEWLFRIEVTGFDHKLPKTRYPRALASVGAAPEQYTDPEEGDADGEEETAWPVVPSRKNDRQFPDGSIRRN